MRTEEIANLLEYFKQIYLQNPDLQVSSDTIYSVLMSYGFNEEEYKDFDLRHLFYSWINRYSSSKKLCVFHSERQNSFLQFHNTSKGFHHKCVKLYISYPKEYMYECANKIFDYIEKNDISTYSKVANRIRSDSIVLRISDIKDAEKVINFINKDPILSSKAKYTNPFLVRDGVVGVAYDHMMSYNSIISDLVASYIQYHRNNNTLNLVSFLDFKNYVELTYFHYFKNVSNISKFKNDFISSSDIDRSKSVGAAILNYEEVYNIIIMMLNKATSKDILNKIEKYQDKENSLEFERYYDDVITNQSKKQNIEVAKQIFDNYIRYASLKYGKEFVDKYISSYIIGNENAITRDNNFRQLFNTYLTSDLINTITNNNLRGYVTQILNEKEKNDSVLKPELIQTKYILDEYIKYAIIKYGSNCVEKYLKLYINGTETAITRDNNFRQLFYSYVKPNDIYLIAGDNLNEYIESFLVKEDSKTY